MKRTHEQELESHIQILSSKEQQLLMLQKDLEHARESSQQSFSNYERELQLHAQAEHNVCLLRDEVSALKKSIKLAEAKGAPMLLLVTSLHLTPTNPQILMFQMP
jgi:hypothetical protein